MRCMYRIAAVLAFTLLAGGSAFAGTAVFTGNSDADHLALSEGGEGAAVVYTDDAINITTDDRGGWGAASVSTVPYVGIPKLKGLGTIEITMSDISQITEWWHKYYARVFVQDAGGNEIGILVFRVLPIGGGGPNTAIDIVVYDASWGQLDEVSQWDFPVSGTTHMKLVFSDTTITPYVDDGSGGWIASTATLDLTNLSGLGDATVAGSEYKGRIEIMADGAANMTLGFDEIKIEGPEIPDVNTGGGETGLPVAGIAGLVLLSGTLIAAAYRKCRR